MRCLSTTVAVVLVTCLAGASLAEEAAAEADDQGGNLRDKMAFTVGPGYPDMVAVSLAVGVPDVFEWEAGAAWFVLKGFSAQMRVGYPWRVVGDGRRGFELSLIPKVGARYVVYDGECISIGPGCTSGGGGHCGYQDIESWGLNAVLSIEPTYMFHEGLGLVFQVTGGATMRFYGIDHEVTEHCDDGDVTITHGAERRWRPDLRFAVGIVF